MPLISPNLREQIRAASDIVEVVGGYVPLRRSGGSFVALCPFHKEKTPSFHVSPAPQAYYCFGCHKGGDVFNFVQEYENISFFEAARRLAERAGIRIEVEETPRQREDRAHREELLRLHEQITQRWQAALENDTSGQVARDYLLERGVPAEAVRLFRLGFAPDAWDDTVNWARAKGWDSKIVEDAGLIIPRESTDPTRGHYDRFRGRLIFPIADEQGRVIGFSGRTLKPEEKTAKYVNSPETPIFTKSRVLYGLDKTKRAILDAGSAIICEGQLDLIASYMAGVQNLVAPQGTALTGDHLRILRRYAKEVVLCFDSDLAGQKAAARILDELLASGLSVRVITVPSPHDPDSYIRAHGPPAFRELVTRARDFFEFYLEFLCVQHDVKTDRGRLGVLEAMAAAVGKAGNEVLADRYAQRTAMALSAGGGVALSPDAVRTEFRKHGRTLARTPPRRSTEPADSTSKAAAAPSPAPSPSEFWLLKLLFLKDEFAGWLALHLDPAWIQHAGVRHLVSRILQAHKEGAWHSPAAFLGDIEEPNWRGIASHAMTDDRAIPNPEQQLTDVVLHIRNAWMDQEISRCAVQVENRDLSDSQRLEILGRLQSMRRAKREPLVAKVGVEASASVPEET